jgi:hypothetical protein
MHNRFKLLNSQLDQAQELMDKGDTATASDIIQMVLAECTVTLADRLTELEKHLATLVAEYSRNASVKADQPVDLEKVTKILKGG